jgi:RHS repeat-associated protein
MNVSGDIRFRCFGAIKAIALVLTLVAASPGLAYDPPLPGGDCNDNGIADSTDISNDSSLDCNSNGIIDACEFNYALSLDGNGDKLEIPSPTNFDFEYGLTIEFWLKINTLASNPQPVIYKGGNTDQTRNFSIWLNNDGSLFLSGNEDGVATPDVCYLRQSDGTTTEMLSTGTWYHIAAILDRPNGQMKLFKNGALRGTCSISSSNENVIPPPSHVFHVGGNNESGSDYLDGLIDELRVWEVALSNSEISNHYNQQRDITSDNLLGYWNFDEPTTMTVALDLSTYDSKIDDGNMVGDATREQAPSTFAYSYGYTADIDGNQIPDSCDPDCNNNGYPDGYDIQQDPSLDCDNNGVLDSCEIVTIAAIDIHENGTMWDEWHITDNDPIVANPPVAYIEPSTGQTVLKIEAKSANGLCLGNNRWNWGGSNADWDSSNPVLSYRFKGGYFQKYIGISTTGGERFVTINPGSGTPYIQNTGGGDPMYLNIYAGTTDVNEWEYFEFNIEDLVTTHTTWTWTATDGFFFRPSTGLGWNNNLATVYIDDMMTRPRISGSIEGLDADGNGVIDSCDIASNSSLDCDSNGVLDQIEVAFNMVEDCDRDGHPDSCSPDCDSDGIPDRCEIANGTADDCNNNLIPDACEISAQTVPDCNSNGVPDSCDITNGTSEDCNFNGIPDECDSNEAPYFIISPLRKSEATEGLPYDDDIAFDAVDPNTCDVLTFSKINGAAWLNVSTDGLLSGTPTSTDAGLSTFTIRVEDEATTWAEVELQINVLRRYMLTPVADAFVDSAYPNTNYGTTDTLIVQGASYGPECSSFLKFDIPSTFGVLRKSVLHVYDDSLTTESPYRVSISLVEDSNWTETGITFSNAPTTNTYHFNHLISANTVNNIILPIYRWGSNKSTSLTLEVMPTDESTRLDFFSRDQATSPPVLELILNYNLVNSPNCEFCNTITVRRTVLEDDQGATERDAYIRCEVPGTTAQGWCEGYYYCDLIGSGQYVCNSCGINPGPMSTDDCEVDGCGGGQAIDSVINPTTNGMIPSECCENPDESLLYNIATDICLEKNSPISSKDYKKLSYSNNLLGGGVACCPEGSEIINLVSDPGTVGICNNGTPDNPDDDYYIITGEQSCAGDCYDPITGEYYGCGDTGTAFCGSEPDCTQVCLDAATGLVVPCPANGIEDGLCVRDGNLLICNAEEAPYPAESAKAPQGRPLPFDDCSGGTNPTKPNSDNGTAGGAADPIHFFSGEFYLAEIDMEIPGLNGFDFKWARTYRSRDNDHLKDSPMGDAWDHSYNIYIERKVIADSYVPDGGSVSKPTYWSDGKVYRIMDANPTIENDFDHLFNSYGKEDQYHKHVGYLQADTDISNVSRSVNAKDYLILHDGSGRHDVYVYDKMEGSDVIYTNPGYARRIIKDVSSNEFTLEFGDGGEWDFSNQDSGATETYYINKSTNRHGNEMDFSYSSFSGSAPLLATITDSLDRNIALNYGFFGTAWRVTSVTDWTSRQYIYTYDTSGRLKTKATPESNTCTFTYVGEVTPPTITDPILTDNIESITDAKGQLYLRNEYGTDPSTLLNDYDRVVRQFWGDQPSVPAGTDGDRIDISYEPINNYQLNDPFGTSVIKQRTVLNDRMGNIQEYVFDTQNRLVFEVTYTGRSTAPLSADSISIKDNGQVPGEQNMPTDGDNSTWPSVNPWEDFGGVERYLTYHMYDPESSRLKMTVRPDGTVTKYFYKGDGNPEAPLAEQANLVRIEEHQQLFPTNKLVDLQFEDAVADDIFKEFLPQQDADLRAAQQAMIVKEFTYLEGKGNCGCGSYVDKKTDGNGNIINYDLNDDGAPKSVEYEMVNDLAEKYSIFEYFEYDDSGRIISHVHPSDDPESAYPTGSGHRRKDVFLYYDSSVSTGDTYTAADPITGIAVGTVGTAGGANSGNNGYLAKKIIDYGDNDGLKLTTVYEYDSLGRVIHQYDPKSNKTTNTWDNDDRLTKVQYPELPKDGAPGQFIRYEKVIGYDANDNIDEIIVHNIDQSGTQIGDTNQYKTTFTYDILNNPTLIETEVFKTGANVHKITTKNHYDDNSNLIKVEKGQASYSAPSTDNLVNDLGVNAGSPTTVSLSADTSNVIEIFYDERNRPWKIINGAGSVNETRTRLDYYLDDNVLVRVIGIDTNNDPLPESRLSYSRYDDYGRLTVKIDQHGNKSTYKYDANGNLLNEIHRGEITDIGYTGEFNIAAGDSPIILNEIDYKYDNLDRNFEKRERWLVPSGGEEEPTGYVDGVVSEVFTRFTWGDNSLLREHIDDKLQVTKYEYDSANRLSKTTDAEDNYVINTYDANSNVTRITEWELGNVFPYQLEYQYDYKYDELDRRIEFEDSMGNITKFAYDSRSNIIEQTDALGNITDYTYDGLDRLITTSRQMVDGGVVNGVPSPLYQTPIKTKQIWDDSNRLVAQIDGNGNITQYAYDSQDRKIKTTYADTTDKHYEYNIHSDIVKTTDQNETILEYETDGLGRLHKLKATTVAPGIQVDYLDVANNVVEEFTYDGMNRLRIAEDSDTTIIKAYDSLSRVIYENLRLSSTEDFVVRSEFEGVGNKIRLYYPEVERSSSVNYLTRAVIEYSYDKLNRISTIRNTQEGGNEHIAQYTYNGDDAVESITYHPQSRMRMLTHYEGFHDWHWPTAQKTVQTSQFESVILESTTRSLPQPASFRGWFAGTKKPRWTHYGHRVEGDSTGYDRSFQINYQWDALNLLTERNRWSKEYDDYDYLQQFDYDSAYRMTESKVWDTVQTNPTETTGYQLDSANNRISISDGMSSKGYEINDPGPPPVPIAAQTPNSMNQYLETPEDIRYYDKNGNLVRSIEKDGAKIANFAYDYKNRLVSYVETQPTSNEQIHEDGLSAADWDTLVGAPMLSSSDSGDTSLGDAIEIANCTGCEVIIGDDNTDTLNSVSSNDRWDDTNNILKFQYKGNYTRITVYGSSNLNAITQLKYGDFAPSTVDTQSPPVAHFSMNNSSSDWTTFIRDVEADFETRFPGATWDNIDGIRFEIESDPGVSFWVDQIQTGQESTGITTTYTYDAYNRRTGKTVDGDISLYVWDGDHIIEERSADAGLPVVATYTWGARIDEPLRMTRDVLGNDGIFESYYYALDAQGNVVALVDSNGAYVERYEYDDFGQTSVYVPNNANGMWGDAENPRSATTPVGSMLLEGGAPQFGNPYMYNGRRFDGETGLYYYRARYLDPASGRFITRDPLGIWGDALNLGNGTAYTANNPWTYNDPYGLKAEIGNAHPASPIQLPPRSLRKKHCGDDLLMAEIDRVNRWKKQAGETNPDITEAVGNTAEAVTVTAVSAITPVDEVMLTAAGAAIAVKGTKNLLAIEKSRIANRKIFRTWNEYQAGTKGKFETRGDAAKGWAKYKIQNNIVTGTQRSQSVKKQYLKNLGKSGKAPRWMNQWLRKGEVPPGYNVDHKVPLSVGGTDTMDNMRFQRIDIHQTHHKFYAPWRNK